MHEVESKDASFRDRCVEDGRVRDEARRVGWGDWREEVSGEVIWAKA